MASKGQRGGDSRAEMEGKASGGNSFSEDTGARKLCWRPAQDGENEVVKIGWHWLVEKEKMLFLKSKT